MGRMLSDYPELVQEFHPTKNGDLTPDKVHAGSGKPIWWLRHHYDERTGKYWDFEWQASPCSRTNPNQLRGCPQLSGRIVVKGFNDLLSLRPDIAADWHPTLNGSLTPDMVTVHSTKKVWWRRLCFNKNTGKYQYVEWKDTVDRRTGSKDAAPGDVNGRRLFPGFNDLATLRPDIAVDWHPTRNGTLTPNMVGIGSTEEVWWRRLCRNQITGENQYVEWKDTVAKRTGVNDAAPGDENGRRVFTGFNDLATLYPDIAAEFHPTLNGNLTADTVSARSDTSVWWLFHYYDEELGRYFDLEWKMTPYERTVLGYKCPYVYGRKVLAGFNDFKTRCPVAAADWHPTKNGKLTPEMVKPVSHKKVWWLKKVYCKRTNQYEDVEWQDTVINRALKGAKCPAETTSRLVVGFNDFETMCPETALEWNYARNGDLRPDQFLPGSNEVVWWIKKCRSPFTGEYRDIEWQASIAHRAVRGDDCPVVLGKMTVTGFNDLLTAYPEFAAEVHPTMNGDLAADKIYALSTLPIWWVKSVFNDLTGEYIDIPWRAAPADRIRDNTGCPALCGKLVVKGYNDLESRRPHLAEEYNVELNHSVPASAVYYLSQKNYWWTCKEGHHWRSKMWDRVTYERGCPICRKKTPWA